MGESSANKECLDSHRKVEKRKRHVLKIHSFFTPRRESTRYIMAFPRRNGRERKSTSMNGPDKRLTIHQTGAGK